MLNDESKKDIIGFELINQRGHRLFRPLQLSLKQRGYKLTSAEKFLKQECTVCSSHHHLSMVYRNGDDVREFVMCLECWTVHELMYIYGDE